MKIVHVIPQLWVGNGAAKIVKNLVFYQVTQGDTVSVVSLSLLAPTYDEDLQRLGCNVIYLERKKYALYHPKFFFKLRKIIKDFDIVHVHLFPALYWVVLSKLFLSSRCKSVYTEHSTLNNRQGKKWLKPLECFIYNRYDAIVSISDAVSDYLRKYVDSTLQSTTIANGIDLSAFVNAKPLSHQSLGVPDDIVLITQVARFNTEKDQLTLMRALTHLPSNFHVMFVGTGVSLEKHRELAENMGISNRTHFMGLRNDVPALLKSSDIVVMSSHYEGFGLAALEGMAAGKPVVASDVPGLSEVVQGAGVLFPVHNDQALANEIMCLAEDIEYASTVTELCLNRAKMFDVNVMANKYYILYRKLINSK